MAEHYELRGHHVFNLINGYVDCYSCLKEGLARVIAIDKNGLKRPVYTSDDSVISKVLYSEIASDPNNTVEIIRGIDDRCKVCTNSDRTGCDFFRERDLRLEDKRSLREASRRTGILLKVGGTYTVAELLAQHLAA